MFVKEQRYKQKCKDLKKRILEVEDNNKVATLAIERTKIAVNRLRLEYAVLLERLEKKAVIPDGDNLSDSSSVSFTKRYIVQLFTDFEQEIEISEKKSNGKRKKGVLGGGAVRDPDMPKRPLNPYLV